MGYGVRASGRIKFAVSQVDRVQLGGEAPYRHDE